MKEQPSLPGMRSSGEVQEARRAKVVAATIREVCRIDSFRQIVQEKQLDRAHLSILVEGGDA